MPQLQSPGSHLGDLAKSTADPVLALLTFNSPKIPQRIKLRGSIWHTSSPRLTNPSPSAVSANTTVLVHWKSSLPTTWINFYSIAIQGWALWASLPERSPWPPPSHIQTWHNGVGISWQYQNILCFSLLSLHCFIFICSCISLGEYYTNRNHVFLFIMSPWCLGYFNEKKF